MIENSSLKIKLFKIESKIKFLENQQLRHKHIFPAIEGKLRELDLEKERILQEKENEEQKDNH